MSNSFNSILNEDNINNINNIDTDDDTEDTDTDDYVTSIYSKNINNINNFTDTKISWNSRIIDNIENTSTETVNQILIVKDKVIETLTKTNENLVNVISNFNSEIDDTNKYIKDITDKINNKDIYEITKELKNIRFEHNELKIKYKFLNNRYFSLKKTFNGLNNIYIHNIINHFNDKETLNIFNIQKELMSIKKNFLCSICFENNINIILKPCGHVPMCDKCINNMHQFSQNINCPLCNEPISEYNKIFLPI